MGITGLIPLLKEAHSVTHISDYAGQTLAIDAYVWLHRGAYSCAQELGTGQPTLKYCNYALEKIRMLKHFKVTPYVVFDGGALPAKQGTEKDRDQRRNEALAKGNECLANGNISMARDHFVKGVDVTPEMAYQLIKALKKENVQYVVAPYEADPQLAYLERIGLVDGIITEDSDLLVFGCKKILFKLDKDGSCLEIRRENFTLCREINLSGWTIKEFRQMAILSGCDYLNSINGIGLKKAYALMRKFKTAEKSIQSVRLEGKFEIPSNYVRDFKRAELTFCHQRVFDPLTQDMVHLEPVPDGVTEEELFCVGALMETEFIRGIAAGLIDPLTKLPVIDINPNSFTETASTMTRTSFYRAPKAKAVVIPAKGAASLLSFFSKSQVPLPTPAPTPSTSKLPPIPKYKPVTMILPVKLAVKSKFFGGDKKGKVKASSQEKDDPIELEQPERLPSPPPLVPIDLEDSGFFEPPLGSPILPTSPPCNISSPVSIRPILKRSESRILEPTTPTKKRKLKSTSSNSTQYFSEIGDDLTEFAGGGIKSEKSEMEGISSPVEILYEKPVGRKPVLSGVLFKHSQRQPKLEFKKERGAGIDSDPIDCGSSNFDEEEDSREFDSPPKKMKRGGGALSGRTKKKKIKVEMIEAEEMDEVKDEARGSVIAGWRQKFMITPGIKAKNIQTSLALAASLMDLDTQSKSINKFNVKEAKPKSVSQPTKKLPRSPLKKSTLVLSSPIRGTVEKVKVESKPLPSNSRLLQFQFKGFTNV